MYASQVRAMLKKYFVLPVLYLLLLGGIVLLLPIKMGNQVNAHIPIIGHVEAMSDSYYTKTLLKATVAYVSAKVVNRAISMVQRAEVAVTPAGVGLTFAPGELLAAANDGIERVSTALFSIIGILLVQKLLVGMVSFACIKCLLPLALACFFVNSVPYLAKIFPFARALGLLACKMAVLIWCIFPVSVFINNYIEENYLDAKYEETMGSVQKDERALEESTALLHAASQQKEAQKEEDSSVLGWMKDKWDTAKTFVKNPLDTIGPIVNKALAYADNIIDKLFIIFSVFVVTTIIIPLGVYVIFMALFRAFVDEARRGGIALRAE